MAMDALMALIADIKSARQAARPIGAGDARRHQRRAQFLLDFIEAENSMGFHADQEAMRVLALSLDETRRGQAALPGSVSALSLARQRKVDRHGRTATRQARRSSCSRRAPRRRGARLAGRALSLGAWS